MFITYRTPALLLPQTFSSSSWSSRGSSRLPRAPTSLPLPPPVHQHSFLTGCVSWNCWAAKSEALSTTMQLPNIPGWPAGYRGCLLWLKHLPLCVPGRYTVTFSGVFPLLQETNHSGTDQKVFAASPSHGKLTVPHKLPTSEPQNKESDSMNKTDLFKGVAVGSNSLTAWC